jgi:hypothetical protein
MKSDPVCPYCHRPLIEIYYYGEVLVGCLWTAFFVS